MNKRYFFVTYVLYLKYFLSSEEITFNVFIDNDKGNYIMIKSTQQALIEYQKKIYKNADYHDVTITNIIELNEKDYNDLKSNQDANVQFIYSINKIST